MFFDLDIWRFIITFGFAKSLTWEKDGDLYLLHIGTISEGDEVAIKIIFLPFLLMVGFDKSKGT
tara:strand:+ start:641 stop:832 length:192 start_codon:yes stop_codon:yes gene_type:complete